MRLNPYLKEELVNELKSVSRRMIEETDPSKKLFYYSAAYGITNRVMRFEFDEELLLVDALLTITYNARYLRHSPSGSIRNRFAPRVNRRDQYLRPLPQYGGHGRLLLPCGLK